MIKRSCCVRYFIWHSSRVIFSKLRWFRSLGATSFRERQKLISPGEKIIFRSFFHQYFQNQFLLSTSSSDLKNAKSLRTYSLTCFILLWTKMCNVFLNRYYIINMKIVHASTTFNNLHRKVLSFWLFSFSSRENWLNSSIKTEISISNVT